MYGYCISAKDIYSLTTSDKTTRYSCVQMVYNNLDAIGKDIQYKCLSKDKQGAVYCATKYCL